MKIAVTADDIREGRRYVCERCPVALALLRACADGVFVRASYFSAALWFAGREAACQGHVTAFPAEATRFVDDFDRGLDVAPFEFELDVPTRYARAAP